MEAIRQVVRIPRNREIKIKVPDRISEDQLMEVILLVKDKRRGYQNRIKELKRASKDPMYLKDMEETLDDFKYTELEGWG